MGKVSSFNKNNVTWNLNVLKSQSLNHLWVPFKWEKKRKEILCWISKISHRISLKVFNIKSFFWTSPKLFPLFKADLKFDLLFLVCSARLDIACYWRKNLMMSYSIPPMENYKARCSVNMVSGQRRWFNLLSFLRNNLCKIIFIRRLWSQSCSCK